jgi:hypothetical protein
VSSSYYFAARYGRHAELRQYRTEMLAAIPGTVITSRWIDCHDGELEASYTPDYLNANPDECWKYGQHDLEDLADSDAIVSFTGDGGGGKGGRHVEHGIAIAYVDNHPWCLREGEELFRLIVVGPRENIFHCHPHTEAYPSWAEFLAAEARRQASI